ncbi:MAG: 1-acyl-sn-glycerol-3-phosphate acyltransferase [Bacteroidales bacterium]|nr:1-acyl-sn-glycerol-3-phosphate acyltransferase [Bacteroidales bacterium]
MKRLFLSIYSFLAPRKSLMWILLVFSTLTMVLLTANVRVDENISSFFPSQSKESDFVMKNMKAMDKIIVVVEDTNGDSDIYTAAEMFADSLERMVGDALSLSLYYDDESEDELLDYVYSHLPYLLTADDYLSVDSLTTDNAITAKMVENRQLLAGPLGVGYARLLSADPMGIAMSALAKLQTIKPDNNISMQDGFMMSDGRLVMFITMHDDFSKTGDNAKVVDCIRNVSQSVGDVMGVSIYAYGAPVVAVCNSGQVKRDETVTVTISLALTAVVIFMVFKRKRAVLLIILPVCYGALFAFAFTSMLGMQLSLISVGTGAMVLGLAMSYSIHMLTHSLHSESIEQLVSEMAYPMTVGSITTIGAFVGLIFTDSKILQDLGIFAAAALVGTLLFCLIFMPHFLVPNASQKKSFALRMIERFAGYDYSSNRVLVGVLVLLVIVGLCFFNNVGFSSDMNNLNYHGDEWVEKSQQVVESTVMPNDTSHHATLVVTGHSYDELARNGELLTSAINEIPGIYGYTSLSPWFLQSDSVRQDREDRWNSYWTSEKRQQTFSALDKAALTNGFELSAFSRFKDIIDTEVSALSENGDMPSAFEDYLSQKDSTLMLYVNLSISNSNKDAIMDELSMCRGTVVTDMGYFVRKATSGIISNFNYILLLSSILVGLVLLLSYTRFELFIMTFLPMCISWVIILGMMALFGVEFNVVNIILSTFIFGVGDDFSIFIMDGLLSRYKGEKDMFLSHKTAIALSGLAIVIGLGVQVFAQHPACKSIGYLSIFGLVAVIFTSYVVQPILFRIFISNPAKKGQPYTVKNLLRSIAYYGIFLMCCIIAYIALGLLFILPMKNAYKKTVAHYILWLCMKAIYWIMGLSFPVTNIGKVDISSPCVIVANHQSFIDLLYVLSISPKIVCITKSWVVNSPFFGPLTKYCDFYNADEGSDEMIDKMRSCIDRGYSIVVFPEGTRSADCRIHRFHKGAFLLAEKLSVDILPIVVYGNGMVASKVQPFNLKNGWIVNKVMPRISRNELSTMNYVEQTKHICQLMRNELEEINKQYDIDDNPYYREAVLHNYVYKDVEAYWHMRMSLGSDKDLLHSERLKLGV